MVVSVSRLELVPPREVWESEPRDFTPWLADNQRQKDVDLRKITEAQAEEQRQLQMQQMEIQKKLLAQQKNSSDLQALQLIQGSIQSMQPQQPQQTQQGLSGKPIINCNTARVGGGNLRQTTCY